MGKRKKEKWWGEGCEEGWGEGWGERKKKRFTDSWYIPSPHPSPHHFSFLLPIPPCAILCTSLSKSIIIFCNSGSSNREFILAIAWKKSGERREMGSGERREMKVEEGGRWEVEGGERREMGSGVG